MKKLFFCTVLAAAALFGDSQVMTVKTVHGRGRNADFRTAVNEALVQAMSQVAGVSLQDSRDSLLDSLLRSSRNNGTVVNVDEVSQTLKQTVQAKTKGHVLDYKITEERFDQELKLWYIEVDARVPGKYVIGRDPDNLRRMVVLPFRMIGDAATVYGEKLEPRQYCESIARSLNENLTHTRRFTMLDREFDSETTAELGRLDLENASPGDFGRFNQRLVTDYAVIGTVKVYSSPAAAAANPYTGTAGVSDGPFLEVSYRVILVPTTQLKWANTVTIPYSMAGGGGISAMMSTAAAAAANSICEEIIANIYPIRVTGKTQFELVLNQGGKNIRQGDAFGVFQTSAPVTDVTTGESLGGVEEMIAKAVITRVTPKMSYAQVVEGTPLEAIPVGAIVRRPTSLYVRGAPTGAASPVQAGPDGVKPPWKK